MTPSEVPHERENGSSTKQKSSISRYPKIPRPSIPQAPLHVSQLVWQQDVQLTYYDQFGQGNNTCLLKPSRQAPFMAPIIHARRLTSADSDHLVVEITIDMTESNLECVPGDAIGVLAHNDPNLVMHLLTRLKLDHLKNVPFNLVPSHLLATHQAPTSILPSHIKTPTTLTQVFGRDLDITGLVTKRLLVMLAGYCSDSTEKETLINWATSKQSYLTNIENRYMSVVDLLDQFMSCSPDIGHLLDSLPALAPRNFSFANDSQTIAKLVLSVVNLDICGDDHVSHKTFKGLCSNWLYSLVKPRWLDKTQDEASCKVSIIPRPVQSKFRLPSDPSIPIIMVSAGTGIAPFMSFLEKRQHIIDTRNGVKLGPAWLFTGHGHPLKDWIYKDELEAYERTGVVNRVIVTFSRLYPNSVQYIQHSMQESDIGEALLDMMIDQDAVFYLCGSMGLVHGVRDTMIQLLQRRGIEEIEATDTLLQWTKSGRYLLDIW